MQSTEVIAAILTILFVNNCVTEKLLRKDRNAAKLLSMAGVPKFMLTQKTKGANFLGYTAGSKCLTIELIGGTHEYTAILDYILDEGWFTDLLTATTNRSELNFTSVDADNGTQFVPTTSVYNLVHTDYSTCFVVISRRRKRKECFLWLRTETTEQQHVSTTCNSTFQSKCRGQKEHFPAENCSDVEQ
uniref:Lipocalin n=1 Tax=Rhipicephalus appendiculatus TaxID=34631 RepID=A0A131YTJ7_RHIAP